MNEDKIYPTVEEWQMWVEQYSDVLLNRAFFLLSDKEEAKDIVQEVFLSAYISRKTFRGDSSPASWLVSILNHKVADWYKVKYRSPIINNSGFHEFDFNGEWTHKEMLGTWPQEADAEEKLLDNEKFRYIFYNCLNHLPSSWNLIVKLSYFEMLKAEDICKELKITNSNLWKIMQRSRLQMRKCLQKNWFDNEDK